MMLVTFGEGLKQPLGHRVEVAGVEGLAHALEAATGAVEGWWSPHTWREDYRDSEAWEGASCIGIDLDLAGHAPLPVDVAVQLEQLAGESALSGSIFHRTPAGARLIFVLAAPCTDSADYVTMARGAARGVEDDLREHGLDHLGLTIDPKPHADLGRLYFNPNTIAKGARRSARVIIMRSLAYPAQNLRELAPAPEQRATQATTTRRLTAVSDPAKRAAAYVRAMGYSVAGNHGDDHAFKVAATLINDFSLPDGEARRLFEDWNTGCEPPWADRDLDRFLRSASKNGKHAAGAKLLEDRPFHRNGVKGGGAHLPAQPGTGSTPGPVSDDAAGPEPTPPADINLEADTGAPLRRWPLTDAGNAERFIARHKDAVRYAHGWDAWLIWDGARWARDRERQVYELAIDVARHIHQEAVGLEPDPAKLVTKHAFASEKRDRLEAMLALARCFPPIAITPDDLDRDPGYLCLPNGDMHLRTGSLVPHDPRRLLSKLSPVPYDAKAVAPTWMAVLEKIMPDPDVRAYLARAVGYALTGSVQEHALFFCYGTGANGKSTFLETIRELLGEEEYARTAAPDLLLAKKQDRHESEIVDLQGARFVTTVEVGDGRAWDEAKVKWLTGGDMLTGRPMYGSRVSFIPSHKFWVAANHRPRARGVDYGFWRRVHFIPFTVTISKEEQDPTLRARLRAEMPGVLAWAIRGAVEWHRTGLQPPAAVLMATEEYRAAEDVVGAFLDECCTLDANGRVLVAALYEEFRKWAERGGERVPPKRAFGDALEDRGMRRTRDMSGRYISGLSLKNTPEGSLL